MRTRRIGDRRPDWTSADCKFTHRLIETSRGDTSDRRVVGAGGVARPPPTKSAGADLTPPQGGSFSGLAFERLRDVQLEHGLRFSPLPMASERAVGGLFPQCIRVRRDVSSDNQDERPRWSATNFSLSSTTLDSFHGIRRSFLFQHTRKMRRMFPVCTQSTFPGGESNPRSGFGEGSVRTAKMK